MQRGVLVRLIIFLIATAAAVIYLVPTFVHELPPWWSQYLPSDRIHLGLDLQGGSHLVLEVKVDKAIENTVERIKDDMVKLATEKKISITEAVRQGTQVRIKAPAASADAIRDLQKNEFSNLAIVNSQVSGGTAEFVLALNEKELRSLRDQTVDQSLETIRNRIDQFGVSEPIIQRQGQQNILVQLPGIQDPERAKEIIGKTALLEFKLVDDTRSVEEALKSGPPPGDQILYGQDRTPYLLQAQALMTGEYIADAHVRPSSRLEGPYVELVLNNTGARLFERITGENVKRRLAIVLDNKVYSAPVIQERIGGGRASITGRFEMKDARDLAIILRAGALPAPVEVAEERTVGPSLGSDSIRQGVISFAVGSSLVILFMLFYYKGAGILADIALIFHILFLLAILAAFGAVLTLPGIAGIVLIAGMAVDANVLINERIREELRAGKSARAAIEAGYDRALPAIIDTNVTTFLSGVILFQFGTGPIKGFAVTLCVGILTTVVTAVYMTRIYYDWRISSRKLVRVSI
ncbi:MAG TPA: protein translocase subunit SecD [Verrucomicrobiae bacterium]|jgi:preprotein translocase subunit SecD|nr:protein translocase subunit SecD [Verrucomicrobiae bacterium]